MKLKRLSFAKLRATRAFVPVLVVGVLISTGAIIYNFNAHAATPGFYFTSSGSSYTVGDTFNVGVYENSGSDCANVVEADFSYPTDLLQYNSVSITGSNFESTAPATSGSGSVSLVQFTTRKACGSGSTATSGVSGDQLIGNVSFTVIGSGTAALNFKDSSIAVSSADNSSNVADANAATSLTLSAAPIPIPTVSPAPVATPAPVASSSPIVVSNSSDSSEDDDTTPVTSITPSGTDTSTPVDDNDVVQLDTPATVEPSPIQPNGVNEVEYFLNDKLVATAKTAPYAYHIDTTKLLNGSYTLTTKTLYSNGQTKSVSQTLVVKNKFGFTQFKLELKKFTWLVILLILLLVAGLIAWLVHKRGGSGSDTYYDDGTYELDGSVPPAGLVQPNTPSQAPSAPEQSATGWQPRPVSPTLPRPTSAAPPTISGVSSAAPTATVDPLAPQPPK